MNPNSLIINVPGRIATERSNSKIFIFYRLMRGNFLISLSLLYVVCWALGVDPPQPKRRNRNQPTDPTPKHVPVVDHALHNQEHTLYPTNIPHVGHIPTNSHYRSLADCPSCWATKRNTVQLAVDSFWQNDLKTAFACACHQLSSNPDDGFAQAIIYSLTQVKHAPFALVGKFAPPAHAAPPIRKWEVLGPINVGKLEHDADATFQQPNTAKFSQSSPFDPIEFVLGTYSNRSVRSELATDGLVRWKMIKTNEQGEVEVRFPALKWNEVIQGVSSMATYEFQAWARSASYIHAPGSYVVSCSGTHTVYVRNDNFTHVLVGDVYRSGRIAASLDLRIGLVGFAVPLRGVGQTSFRCSIQPAANSIAVYPAQNVPDLLEFSEVPGKGYLLTSAFALPVQNLQNSPLTVEFTVEKPMGLEGEFFVREARPLQSRRENDGADPGYVGELSIAPGQLMLLSLELLPVVSSSLPFISCRKNRPFEITVVPSRGNSVKVPVELKCRKVDQSFLISYLDHDQSVAQAAVVFPLEYHNEHFRLKNAENVRKSHMEVDNSGIGKSTGEEMPQAASYPVLLSTHGSGIPAANHADAHKMVPSGMSDYVFGVEGFIVLAPSRFGAHNWEATGELSARHALHSLRTILQRSLSLKLTPKVSNKLTASRSMLPLPQVRLGSGIVSGHSMGAHGAWMLAVNSPDLFTCLAPLSGWINKEEYGSANAFFHLDSSSSYVEPQLKELLESSMSDTHADKLMHNVQGMDVHIRVGGVDMTTHPWYSRRMQRLLEQLQVNSTYEELPGKEHWWWDTNAANDGGVINDPRMRAFYVHCKHKAAKELASIENHDDHTNTTAASPPVSVSVKDGSLPLQVPPVPVFRRPCDRNVTLTVINPGTSAGQCGVQILQQWRIMSRSSVRLRCAPLNAPPQASKPAHNNRAAPVSLPVSAPTCTLVARNVRRLSVKVGAHSALRGDEHLLINNVRFDLQTLRSTAAVADFQLDLCWDKASDNEPPHRCIASTESHGLISEKSVVNYGPIRHVYARPFCIVYGTPQSQTLRVALRNLAVYLGNAHAAAYHTHVRVLSDLEYQASRQASRSQLANIIFIGGSNMNKAMAAMYGDGSRPLSTPAASRTADGSAQLFGKLPQGMKFSSAINGATGRHHDYQFEFDSSVFDAPDQSVIFTMPFYRPAQEQARLPAGASKDAAVAMAVCIHANSAQGYLHMSRLAWSVVPPMVRTPFSTYLPDYMVLDDQLWALGMGAVLKGGYWDNEWKVSADQSYSNNFSYFERLQC